MHVNAEPYPDILATAEKLLADDCTLDRYGKIPTAAALETGYAIGGAWCPGWSVSLASVHYDNEAVARKLALWIQQQPSNVRYFGSWTDKGCVYFDGVTIEDDYIAAVLLGFERGEKAIYSFETGDCIVLKEE